MTRRSRRKIDTRSGLMDAAWELFAGKGYDDTTVEAIIDRVGVSKGAFYHHFSSKEEVLDSVVERMIDRAFEEIKPVADDKSLSAVGKLNRFLAAARAWRSSNIDTIMQIARVIYRDENVIIRHKMNARTVELGAPLLTRIIDQGLKERVFDVGHPRETALLILHLSNVWGEVQVKSFLDLPGRPDSLDKVKRRVAVFTEVLERILGAPKDSVEAVDRDFVDSVYRAFLKRK